MARVLRRCPKCARKITNKIECRSCGLLFERYFKADAQKRAAEKSRDAKKNKFRRIVNSTISLIFIVVIGGAALYFYNTRTPAVPSPGSDKTLKQQSVTSTQTVGGTQDSANVSRAKLATVSISAPGGSGTGFLSPRIFLLPTDISLNRKRTAWQKHAAHMNHIVTAFPRRTRNSRK